jgi:hypothetical protein
MENVMQRHTTEISNKYTNIGGRSPPRQKVKEG